MPAQLVLVRVDDRLIHGQVAIGWVKATQPEILIVANDGVAADPMLTSLMEMAAPAQIQVKISTLVDLPKTLDQPELSNRRVLLLFSSLPDVIRALDAGVVIKELNLGGLRASTGKRQILPAIALDDQDHAMIRKLWEHGVRVTIQMVPTDEAQDLHKWVAGSPRGMTA
jgi:mannose PTS system EIIAB component